jgi:hypothetical protein
VKGPPEIGFGIEKLAYLYLIDSWEHESVIS